MIQLQGVMRIQASSKRIPSQQQMIHAGHSLLLPCSCFAEHQVNLRPIQAASSLVLIAVFKAKTVTKLIKFPGRIPHRLRHQMQDFLDSMSQPPAVFKSQPRTPQDV